MPHLDLLVSQPTPVPLSMRLLRAACAGHEHQPCQVGIRTCAAVANEMAAWLRSDDAAWLAADVIGANDPKTWAIDLAREALEALADQLEISNG